MNKWTVVGSVVGFLFGFNGISMIFNMLGKVVSEVAQIAQLSALILLILAIILIVKVRILTELLVGAIIGAIVNTILRVNGIDLIDVILRGVGWL